MSLRFKCIILDHDDTAVQSAAEVHHPAHVEAMKQLRPEQTPISVEGWLLKNFHPGVMEYLAGELAFTEEELAEEYVIWRRFSTTIIPEFFPGFLPALKEYKDKGGFISVVSHSEKEVIERHYRKAESASGVFPDLIFGWDVEADRRKPSPWPVQETLARSGCRPGQALIVDDLKPAVIMGKATGVPVAAAGWGHSISEIRQYMKEHCSYYLESMKEFRELILSEE